MAQNRGRRSVAMYRSELQNLEKTKQHTGKVTQESVDSTRRMLQLVDECQDAGINTLKMLHHQGESLNRAEVGLDGVDNNLHQGDKTIKNIEFLEKVPCIFLPCYLCYKSAKNNRKKKKSSMASNKLSKIKPSRNNPEGDFKYNSDPDLTHEKPTQFGDSDFQNPQTNTVSLEKSTNSKTRLRLPEDRFFKRITGAPEENEIEENLNHVSNYLTNLKHQANDMGTTVTQQNSQLDRMNEKALVHHSKVTELKERTTKLINKKSSGTLPVPGLLPGSRFCPCPCSVL